MRAGADEDHPIMGGQSRKVTGGNIGLLWVKMRNSHPEQMFSALPPKADSSRTSGHDRFVPAAEVGSPLIVDDALAGRAWIVRETRTSMPNR